MGKRRKFMEYIQLKKLFHINESECSELYLRRFNGETTKRLGITLNNGFECFYLINSEILSLIDKIYAINTWMEKIMASEDFPLAAKNCLIVTSLVEEIKSSNQMEGIYSTRKELKDMIVENKTGKYNRFYGMVNKYHKLWKNNFDPLTSVSEIRSLYDEVLLDDIVKECEKDRPDGILFRKESVEIKSGIKAIHTGITGENNIINMLEKSLKIVNDQKTNFLIRTVVFHYLFEYTHPFYNGNGRMGRFLVSGYLSLNLNILCALQFSIACLHNNRKYYEAFELTNDIRNKGDLTVFIIYILEIYLSGLEELKVKIENTVNTYKYMSNKLCNYVDDRYKDFVILILQVTLFGVEGFLMPQLVKLTGYTEQSIRNIIKVVNKEYNIIKIDKENKPYKYSIDLDVVSDLD